MMDRPRRSTRNSLYATPPASQSNSTPSSSQTSNGSGNGSSSSSTPQNNPYKKPSYLAGRPGSASAAGKEDSFSSPRRGGGRGRGRGRGGGSSSGSRRLSSRPECVAPRVESRRSTGSSSAGNSHSGKKKKRGAYNNSQEDYHYGSDFEDSDQAGSEGEAGEDPVGSESDAYSDPPVEEDHESDSDFSLPSSSHGGKGQGQSGFGSRAPSPPVPLWMDAEKVVEELELPKSSDDLLLDRDLVMKAVAIYEPVRRFHQLVRLTPFRFEDFCAALANEEASSLLAEIHIQLLKTVLREEENNGTIFGPPEVKDSIAAVLFFIDNLTWPECLRAYIESDPNWTHIHKEISQVEYPFCGPEVRIKVLSWMVDQFLATNLVREALVSEDIKHDDHCRHCHKLGDLVMCDTCPAVYHFVCTDPPFSEEDPPPPEWQCPVCVKNNISGITDCASDMERAGLLIRHEKLGYDRHGRKYWFLARRLLVESEDGSSVWYYSTPLQVEELLYRLDEENYEAVLVENIKNFKEEIIRQMEVTEQITNQANTSHKRTYIEAENAFLLKIHDEREKVHQQEIEELVKQEEKAREAKRIEEEKKLHEEEELKVKEELERKRIREERLHRRNQNKFTDYNPADWTGDETSSKGSPTEAEGEGDRDGPPSLEREVKEEEQSTQEASQSTSSPPEVKEEPMELEEEPTTQPINPVNGMTDSQIANADTQVISYDDLFEPVKTESADVKDEKPEVKTEETNTQEEEKKEPISRRKSKALLLDWDTEERMTRLKATGLYKLGQDGIYKTYYNYYNTDPLALNKFQLGEESSKKRTMSHKFSLTNIAENKWNNLCKETGLRSNIVSCLRATLVQLESSIPSTLMHTNWLTLKKVWTAAVNGSSSATDFSKALMTFCVCIRPSVFNPVWFDSAAHLKLSRISGAEKEERKKAEKRDKKDRDDEEERLKLLPQFIKYPIALKHQVYKQKGEEYRLHGRWGWIWMSSLRKCKPKDCRKLGLAAGPYRHVIQVKNDVGKVKTMLVEPNVFDKLMARRQKTTPAKSSPSASIDTPVKTEKEVAVAAEEKMEVEELKPEVAPEPEVKSEQMEEEAGTAAGAVVEEKKADELEETPMEVDKPAEETTATPSSPAVKDEPMEEIKHEVKEEVREAPSAPGTPTASSQSSSSSTTSTDPTHGRKFRTELINVSLGITSANRIMYPKVAHKSSVLDSLLARRVQLQKMEEEELEEKYGDKLELIQQILDNGGKIPEEVEEKKEDVDENGEEILDDSFPLAGIYRYKCYSYMCQSATIAFNSDNKSRTSGVRDYECKCYSPMCRLKYFVQDSNRKKEEKAKQAERARFAQIVKEVKEKKMYTKGDLREKILLKKLPVEKPPQSVKYPIPPSYSSVSSKKSTITSILILPQHELMKLARSGGRSSVPSGFAPAPKFPTGTWGWPYPCGRPLFKTGWMYKARCANTLAAAALQMRILWTSVKWDDIQMKVPNFDGKNQITTDVEIVTSELLGHRIVGRFAERVQYLRRKTVEPIDAPQKTVMREVTPSRSGLRKRKFAEANDRCDPIVKEEWVDEGQLELWEIKSYHDRLDRKNEPITSSSKPGTPSTRTKSGVALKQPEKFDPSTAEKDRVVAKAAQMVDSEVKRAAHLSKRDNHAKSNPSPAIKPVTPTASQQLQQQQAAAGLPANPRSYGASPALQKKVTVISAKVSDVPSSTSSAPASAAVGILNRKSITAQPVAIPRNPVPVPAPQKITLIKGPDGRMQVRGLLPGQTVFTTADGRMAISSPMPQPHIIQPQSQSQTIIIQGQGPNQLQQVVSSTGVIQLQQQGGQQQLINLGNSGIRTVVTNPSVSSSGAATGALPPGTQLTGTINSQGQILLARGGQIIQGSGGQIVIASPSGGLAAPQSAVAMKTVPVSGNPGSQAAVTSVTQATGTSPSASSTSKTIFQDGNKTIIVSGAANLTSQQLQEILKKVGHEQAGKAQLIQQVVQAVQSPTASVVVSSAAASPGQQQQVAPQQTSTVTVSAGQPISSVSVNPTSQQQPQQVQIIQQSGVQGQQIVIPAGSQMATLGGQSVVVKKIIKSPVKSGVALATGSGAGTPISSPMQAQTITLQTPAGTTPAQLQQLIATASSKGALKVDPKTGVVNISASVFQQFQQKLFQQQQQQGLAVSTKSSNLPISIVSPSKNPKIVASSMPGQGSASAVAIKSPPRPIAPATVNVGQKLVSALPSAIPTPLVSSSPQQMSSLPQPPPSSPALAPAAVGSPMTPRPQTPSSVPGTPQKIAAQFMETPDGPKVIVSNVKHESLNHAQLAQIQSQILRQLQEHPVLKDKFKSGEGISQVKIIIQSGPPQSPAASPATSTFAATPPPPPPPPVKPARAETPPKLASPAKTTTSPITNPAHVDAAIAAVASDISAPVILPPKSPRKSPLKVQEEPKPQPAVSSPIMPTQSPKKKTPKKQVFPSSSLNLNDTHSSPPGLLSDDFGHEEVIIQSHHDDIVNEVEVSENKVDNDAPRFVLSQDLIGNQQQEKAAELEPAIGKMVTPSAPQGMVGKSGSSRRKSPVKTKPMGNSDSPLVGSPNKKKITMSQFASPQQLSLLNKQKELLRKDMGKKRILLEREITADVRKEIAKDLHDGDSDTGELEIVETTPKQGKRKTSGGGASAQAAKRRRTSSGGLTGAGGGRKGKARPVHKFSCPCQNPSDHSKATIHCGNCKGIFHEECVGASSNMDFVCANCESSDPNTLYCICRQPYNDKQCYVECDKCKDWLHTHCAGILPVEAESITVYVCPRCDPNSDINYPNLKPLGDYEYAEISKFLKLIYAHRAAKPFMKPVNPAEVPNYYKVIKEPMDFEQISLRVDERMYIRLTDMVGDIVRILDNCRSFNDESTAVFKSSNILEKFCAPKLSLLRNQIGKNKQQ